jgi:hypothetical protein
MLFAQQPLIWIDRVAQEVRTSRAHRVGGYLWYLARCVGRRQALRVTGAAIMLKVGGSSTAARRGLRDLERAGLIQIHWRPRHAALVRLPDDATLRAWGREETEPGATLSRRGRETRQLPGSRSDG